MPSSFLRAVPCTTLVVTRSCSSAAISTATCGTSRTGTGLLLHRAVTSRRREGLALSPKSAALGVVRQFQSETDAIREAPEPRWARFTVLVLAALLASLILIMCLF